MQSLYFTWLYIFRKLGSGRAIQHLAGSSFDSSRLMVSWNEPVYFIAWVAWSSDSATGYPSRQFTIQILIGLSERKERKVHDRGNVILSWKQRTTLISKYALICGKDKIIQVTLSVNSSAKKNCTCNYLFLAIQRARTWERTRADLRIWKILRRNTLVFLSVSKEQRYRKWFYRWETLRRVILGFYCD